MNVTAGEHIAYVDDRGITWFGTAITGVRETNRWPAILVEIEARRLEVPARDVTTWPAAPAAATAPRRARPLAATVRSAINAKTMVLCKVGDPIVIDEPAGASSPPATRVRAVGVITGITAGGRLVVRSTTPATRIEPTQRRHPRHGLLAPPMRRHTAEERDANTAGRR